MDHPMVERIMKTGYPEQEPKFLGEDALGYEIYEGDELFEIDGYQFVKDVLDRDAIEILEILGAETVIAGGIR